MRRSSLGVAIMLVVTGCAVVRAPRVRFAGVEIDHGLAVRAVLGNPNRLALRVSDLHYRLEVGSVVVAQGARPGEMLLPGRDSVEAAFPFTVEWSGALAALSELLADTVSLRVTGSYALSTMFCRRRTQFASERRITAHDEAGRLLERLFGPKED